MVTVLCNYMTAYYGRLELVGPALRKSAQVVPAQVDRLQVVQSRQNPVLNSAKLN